MKLVGANRGAVVTGLDELPGKANFYLGNNPKKWRTNVPTYAKVKYERVYPGIDLVYYGNQRQLEYDFVVSAGADPKAIALQLETGKSKLEIAANGDLVIATEGGEVRFHKPIVYQQESGVTSQESGEKQSAKDVGQRTKDVLRNPEFTIQNSELVSGRFVLRAGNRVGFEVGPYDRTRPLIIDPVLSYSTYVGGSADELLGSVAVDSSGNAYVSGSTCTTDPVNDSSGCDVLVSKLNSTGTGLVYSTTIGGSSGDQGAAMALDSSGNVYVTGRTCSSDFPATTGAFQAALAGPICDAFVAKLNSSGTTAYATFLGGSKGDDVGLGIAVDSSGNAYIAGQTCSSDFPTKNAYQSTFGGGTFPCDGFAAKLNPAGGGSADLLYSTFLGGKTENDFALAVALDSSNLVYVAGQTASSDFPHTSGAYQTALGGVFDEFISKFDMTQSGSSSLLYSTYLGGSLQEQGAVGIAVDSSGNVYICGGTVSTDFPTTSGAFQTTNNSTSSPAFKAFVAKLNPAGGGSSDLIYSTYLGGSGSDGGAGVAVGASGNAYVTGNTCSSDFPHTSDAFQTALRGNCNAFIAKINPAGGGTSDLVFSTYLGGNGDDFGEGIALDSSGNAIVTGTTDSTNFPTSTGAYHTSFGGGDFDGFVTRLPLGNFSFSAIPGITASVGGSGTATVTVNSSGEFNAPVSLTASGQPSGTTAALSPTPVTPTAGGSSTSTLTVTLGLSITPGSFNLNVDGASGLLSHSTTAQVTVQASSTGTSTVVNGLTAIGCIDNSGISGALTNKLTQAQNYINAGQIQDAINTLSALLNELQAQSGKHISTSCTVNGQTFSPTDVLINDVRAILAALKVGSTPNPIMGYIVNSSNVGIAGATVSILNTANTATSDSTGFYFFANTGSLSLNTNYTAQITSFPSGYKSSTPPSQTFMWQGSTITLSNFVVNKK